MTIGASNPSFSVAQLFDPSAGPAAAAARSIPAQAGTCLYDAGIVGANARDGNGGMTLDRNSPNGPHAQAWAEGKGDFYVATDVAVVKFGNTDMVGGQYYCAPGDDDRSSTTDDAWQLHEDGQAAPGNVGGFHAAVIDTQQPGSTWVLSAKIVSIAIMGVEMVCPKFVALSRADYAGFVSTPGDRQHDECRAHFKVQDLVLDTGRVLVADIISVASDGRSLHSWSDSCSDQSGEGGECHYARGAGAVRVPMDGYFPIKLHHDSAGLINCIRVRTC